MTAVQKPKITKRPNNVLISKTVVELYVLISRTWNKTFFGDYFNRKLEEDLQIIIPEH
jgi:hypothetical protein